MRNFLASFSLKHRSEMKCHGIFLMGIPFFAKCSNEKSIFVYFTSPVRSEMNIVSRKLEIGIFFSLIFFFSPSALCDCSAVIIQLCVLTEQENQFFTTSTFFSHKVQSQSSHSLACFSWCFLRQRKLSHVEMRKVQFFSRQSRVPQSTNHPLFMLIECFSSFLSFGDDKKYFLMFSSRLLSLKL
jgi:hypothetical protein